MTGFIAKLMNSVDDAEIIEQEMLTNVLEIQKEKRSWAAPGDRHGVELAIQEWGWSDPPRIMVDLALLSIKLQNMRAEDTLDTLLNYDLVETKTINKWLITVPVEHQTLDWLWINQPKIRGELDKVMALRAGVQYFDNLIGLGIVIHPDMKLDALSRYCETKRCVVGLIEGITPVLCFGNFDDFIRYQIAGRAEKFEVLSLIKIPVLAVGNSQCVTEWIAASGVNLIETDEQELKNLWLPAHTWDSKPLQRFATLLDSAIAYASDVDINPLRSGQGRVMLRTNTLMSDPPGGTYLLSPEELSEITRFLAKKSGANSTGARIREPRDGQLIYRSTLGEIFIRISFIPLDPGGSSYDTLSVDLRLHRRREGSVSLKGLNMQPDVIAACEKAVSYSQGLVLLIGPTNTGKSTTLAGLICAHREIHGDTRKRISIEQPVELFLPGIKQISVPHKDLFAEYFQAILRHDPDMIMIGEIRDEKTANTAVDASLSGHLVASSLHGNDTLIGLNRLINLIPIHKRMDLIEATGLLVAQRLVKKLCSDCYVGETRSPTENEILEIKEYALAKGFDTTIPSQIAVKSSTGCNECQGTGYKGVLPIHELLHVTREIKNILNSGDYTFQSIGKHRTRTLHQSAMELVIACKTTIDAFFI